MFLLVIVFELLIKIQFELEADLKSLSTGMQSSIKSHFIYVILAHSLVLQLQLHH